MRTVVDEHQRLGRAPLWDELPTGNFDGAPDGKGATSINHRTSTTTTWDNFGALGSPQPGRTPWSSALCDPVSMP
jgi:hypothetical protein